MRVPMTWNANLTDYVAVVRELWEKDYTTKEEIAKQMPLSSITTKSVEEIKRNLSKFNLPILRD